MDPARNASGRVDPLVTDPGGSGGLDLHAIPRGHQRRRKPVGPQRDLNRQSLPHRQDRHTVVESQRVLQVKKVQSLPHRLSSQKKNII